MLNYFTLIVSLSIFDLNVQIKEMKVLEFNASDLIPHTFILKKIGINNFLDSTFFGNSNDFSEYYSIHVTNYNNEYIKSCLSITDADKLIKQKKFILKINDICRYVEIFPNFQDDKYDDNYILLNADSSMKYLQIIWENLLYPKLCIDKMILMNNIVMLLRKSIFLLRLRFINYPFLYFNEKLDGIHMIFKQILGRLKKSEKFSINQFIEILNENTNCYDENETMKMYHHHKGSEITSKSKDFYAGCFLTDIANVLGYFEMKGNYSFDIYNIIQRKSILKVESGVCFEIDLDISKIKYNEDGIIQIFLISKNDISIKYFIYKGFNEKILIIVPRLILLNNSIEDLKIKIFADGNLYISEFLNVREIK